MTGRYLAILSMGLLTSCSTFGDRLNALNPMNLFDNNEVVEAAEPSGASDQIEIARPDDGKIDIPRVMNARLEYTTSGVIVRANGEAASLGYHSASLRPLNFGRPDGNGTIWYEFRAMPPKSAQPVGDAFLRTLSVASFIPNSQLGAIEAVTITGTENDVTIRLR